MPPLVPPSATKCPMPIKSNKEDWVLALRVFLKDTLGTSWQIRETKGKARLGIRFKDGSRVFKYIPYKWQRSNQGKIRTFIEEIHELHIKRKIGIEEAFARVKARAPQEEVAKKASKTDFKLILEAWDKWGEVLIKTGAVSESTFKDSFGQTNKALKKISQSADVNSLLMNLGNLHEGGSRTRTQNVQRVARLLRWACSSKGGFILDPDIWTPPREGELGDYIGRKSRELQVKTDKPTTPISDEDFLALLESIGEGLKDKNSNVRQRTEEWLFALKLTRVFGLRPTELNYLEIRRNGKNCLWCVYPKQSNKTATKPRRLFPIYKNWCEEWNLLEKVNRGDKLPNRCSGESFATYLRNNKLWMKLKEEKGLVPYSFRHAFAVAGHEKFNLNASVLAPVMGHTPKTHSDYYSKWFGEKYLEDIFDNATID